MEIKADLHCHGPNEWLNTPKWNPVEIAKLVFGRLDAVGIAEMGEEDSRFEDLKYAGRMAEKAGIIQIRDNQIYVKNKDLLLFRTEEIATNLNGKPQGHVLVFGNKDKIVKGSLDEVLDNAESQNAVVIADHAFTGPHPAMMGIGYALGPEKLKQYLLDGKIHGVEYNGELASRGLFNLVFGSKRKNDMAIDFARKNNFHLIGSSDSHSEKEMKHKGAYTSFYVSEYHYEDAIDIFRKVLKTKGSTITSNRNPGPAFYTDKHALHMGYLLLKSKLEIK